MWDKVSNQFHEPLELYSETIQWKEESVCWNIYMHLKYEPMFMRHGTYGRIAKTWTNMEEILQ